MVQIQGKNCPRSRPVTIKTKRCDKHTPFCACPPANILSFAFRICRRQRRRKQTRRQRKKANATAAATAIEETRGEGSWRRGVDYSWIGWTSSMNRQKNNLSTNQKGYDNSETIVGRLSARRIQICCDYIFFFRHYFETYIE